MGVFENYQNNKEKEECVINVCLGSTYPGTPRPESSGDGYNNIVLFFIYQATAKKFVNASGKEASRYRSRV